MARKTKIGESKIHGKGLLASSDLSAGTNIGVSHVGDWPTNDIGKNYNHSDYPNAISRKVGNKRYVELTRDLGRGEEITLNYRLQPELEQPQDGWKCGGPTGPKIMKGFQNGGGTSQFMWDATSDEWGTRAQITPQQWDEYKNVYSKTSGMPLSAIPSDAYVNQRDWDSYVETGEAYTWMAPSKEVEATPTPASGVTRPAVSAPSTPRVIAPSKPPEEPENKDVILPTVKEEWRKNSAGTWYRVQRPGEGRKLNLKTGT